MKEHAPTQRVLDILEFLSKQEAPCTLTEIASGIGASKSTVFAVLHTMAQRRFLHLDPVTDRYSLGISAFSVGSAYLEQADFLTLLRGEMRSVVEDCGEICQMGILEGGEVLYLIKIDAPQPIRMASFVGKRLPAYATALGKAMLAALPAGQLRALYPRGLEPLTAQTVTDFDKLEAQLEEVRRTGIAAEQEESSEMICCYAVAVGRPGERPVCSVSVSLPVFRQTPERVEAIRRRLLEAKARLERLTGASSWRMEL